MWGRWQREDLVSGQHGASGTVPGAQPGNCLRYISLFLLVEGTVPLLGIARTALSSRSRLKLEKYLQAELLVRLLSSLCHWVPALVPLQSCQCLAWKPRPIVAWGAESQHVVAGYSDGTIRVFSISRTEMELKMHPHAVALTAIAYSTDGEAACCNSGEMLPWGAWLGCASVTLTSCPKT